MSAILKADLHCHSYFSDGAFSPEDLVLKAVESRLDLLALTDHDTVSGVDALYRAAQPHAIKIIRGIELSVRWKMHDIHILGLNIDSHHPEVTTLIQKQNERRTIRAKEMAEQLKTIGVQDAYQKACELAGHERIGRPHLAQVLINEGIVTHMQAAFKRFLARGRLAYVPTAWANIDEAISTIVTAGGHAVVAHPLKYKLTRSKLHQLIDAFKFAGGKGLEVISGESNISQAGELSGLCMRYELLASTGSDYHNDNYSRIKLGRQMSLPLNCKPIWEEWMM